MCQDFTPLWARGGQNRPAAGVRRSRESRRRGHGRVGNLRQRLYQAVKGNGGTVRLVMLPLEAHGYAAHETIEHVLYEMISWFDKYVKNAPPRVKREEAIK